MDARETIRVRLRAQAHEEPMKRREWPAVTVLDDRLVERNGESSKEYLIKWKGGQMGEMYSPT
jgi:hypothetical protein